MESEKLIAAMQKIKDKVDALAIYLIDGSAEKVSIKTAIETTKSTIDKQANDIAATYKTMLIDAPDAESTKTKVEGAKNIILSTDQQIKDLLEKTKDNVNNLNIFSSKASSPDLIRNFVASTKGFKTLVINSGAR